MTSTTVSTCEPSKLRESQATADSPAADPTSAPEPNRPTIVTHQCPALRRATPPRPAAADRRRGRGRGAARRQVERLTATNTLTQKLQSALEESNMKVGKIFMQVVELEGRDLPVSIKKLPAQVRQTRTARPNNAERLAQPRARTVCRFSVSRHPHWAAGPCGPAAMPEGQGLSPGGVERKSWIDRGYRRAGVRSDSVPALIMT